MVVGVILFFLKTKRIDSVASGIGSTFSSSFSTSFSTMVLPAELKRVLASMNSKSLSTLRRYSSSCASFNACFSFWQSV